jgi:hypothetical protein
VHVCSSVYCSRGVCCTGAVVCVGDVVSLWWGRLTDNRFCPAMNDSPTLTCDAKVAAQRYARSEVPKWSDYRAGGRNSQGNISVFRQSRWERSIRKSDPNFSN